MKKRERKKKPIISGLFVFEQKKKTEKRDLQNFFLSVRGSENRKTKRKQKRQTTKKDGGNDKTKNTRNEFKNNWRKEETHKHIKKKGEKTEKQTKG